MKMTGIEEFRGTLKVLGSGLRIGGSQESAGIGELDNPIIRHPITNLPYVPGSSIKGKLRSLLELKHGQYNQQRGTPCDCGDCLVCQLFGCHSARDTKSPTRLVFRDAQPTEDTQRKWEETGVSSETKTEVIIDRNTGTALRGGLHTMERIPADSDFDFSFSLRTFEDDPTGEYYRFLADGYELLSKHYLGGSGSRGYGEVTIVAEDGTPMHEYLRQKAQQ